jgi:hypothetical protein
MHEQRGTVPFDRLQPIVELIVSPPVFVNGAHTDHSLPASVRTGIWRLQPRSFGSELPAVYTSARRLHYCLW